MERLQQWITVKSLPSQFKAYDSQVGIEYRAFNKREVDLMSDDATSAKAKMDIMIAGIRCTGGMPVDSILYDDFRFIQVLRTLSSVANNDFSHVIAFERNTRKRISHNFSLKQINYLDYSAPDLPLKMEIPDSEWSIELTPPTYGRYVELTLANKDIDNGNDRIYFYLPPGVEVGELTPDQVFAINEAIDEYLVSKPVIDFKISELPPAKQELLNSKNEDGGEPDWVGIEKNKDEQRVEIEPMLLEPFCKPLRETKIRITFGNKISLESE